MRRLVLILIGLLVMTFAVRANGGIELRGHLSANETEMQEGYFAVAQDTVLMVRPEARDHPVYRTAVVGSFIATSTGFTGLAVEGWRRWLRNR